MTEAEKLNGVCPLCGDHRGRVVFSGADHLHGVPGSFDVIACASCELWRQRAPILPEESEQFYPEEYRPYQDERSVLPMRKERISHRLRRNYMQWVAEGKPSLLGSSLTRVALVGMGWMLSYTSAFRFNPLAFAAPDKSVLDVGCGTGRFLAEMAAMGWTPAGIELDRRAAEKASARGIEIHRGAFEAVCRYLPEDRRFDLITMRQVIEHFRDPAQALRLAFSRLEPGGFIMIWTPLRDGLMARLFGSHWFNLDLPRHQVLFHKKSLASIVRQAGFQILEQRQLSSTKSITGSLAFYMRDRKGPERASQIRDSYLLEFACRPVVKLLDFFGAGDNGLIVARKPGKAHWHFEIPKPKPEMGMLAHD